MLVKTKKSLAFFSEENKTSLKKTVIYLRCGDEKLATMCIKLSQCSQSRQAPACRETNILFPRVGKRSFLFVCWSVFVQKKTTKKNRTSNIQKTVINKIEVSQLKTHVSQR